MAESLALARGIADPGQRALSLSRLSYLVSSDLQESLAAEAWAAAEAAGDEAVWAEALQQMAGRLPADLRPAAMDRALSLSQPHQCGAVLSSLMAHLDDSARTTASREALAAASRVTDDWARSDVLRRLAPQLGGEQVTEALKLARAIGDPWARAATLAKLAGNPSNEGLRGQILLEALAAARSAPSAWARARALTAIVTALPGA